MHMLRSAIALIFMAALCLAIPALADNKNKETWGEISFSAEELEWLSQKHRIRVRVSYWPPYQFWDNGPKGVSVDYVKAIAEKCGLDVEFYKADYSWAEALANIRDHFHTDLILTIKPTPERANYIAFTQNYLSMPWVIFTRDDSRFISGMDDLSGRTVVIQRGYVMQKLLQENYPNIRLMTVDSTLEAIQELAGGKADAYIGNLAVGTYIIQNNGIHNVKVAAPTPFENHNQAMGIRDDWPELASIMDKALNTMPGSTHSEIRNRWLSVRYEHGISLKTILLWGGIPGILILLVVGYIIRANRKLKLASELLNEEVIQRKAAQEQLEELLDAAQIANRAKNSFIANMSHEIRTPLNGVLGMLNLLEMTDLDEEQSEFVSIGLTSGKNLLSVLNDILDISNIESNKVCLKRDVCSVPEVVQSVCKSFAFKAKEKGLRLSHQISADVPEKIIADSSRLRQILFNLIGNAVKFTNKGSVKVSVTTEETSRSGLSKIVFTVADTGIGIPAGQHTNVFNSFTQVDESYTREFNGTGLGLSIVKRLVDLMDGRIELMSVIGKGTEFRVVLDLVTAEIAREHHTEKNEELPARKNDIRILLAEDNELNRIMTVTTLDKMGYQVHSVNDGSMVIENLREKDFDLVLLDIQMPGLDGVETTSLIRNDKSNSFDPNIPIVALTAHAMDEDRKRFLDSGMDGFVPKPIDFCELEDVIIKAIHSNCT